MKRFFWFIPVLSLFCIFGFQNCAQHSFDANSTMELPIQELVVQSNSEKPANVFFLVDDSYTMAPMQELLAAGIKSVAEERLLGSAVTAKVFRTTSPELTIQSDSEKIITRNVPAVIGSVEGKSITQKDISKLTNFVKTAGVFGSSSENIRHRLAALLADDSAKGHFKAGDRVAIVLISDEDDPADIELTFESTFQTEKTIAVQGVSTVIGFEYQLEVSDGTGSAGSRTLPQTLHVDPSRFSCAGSTTAQQLEVVRNYYRFNPSIRDAPGLKVTSCSDGGSRKDSFQENAKQMINVSSTNVFNGAPKFDVGNQEFGCAMKNFKVRLSKDEVREFPDVLSYIDFYLASEKQMHSDPEKVGYYGLFNRVGDCREVINKGNGVVKKLSTKMMELTGTADVDLFIQKRLEQLTGGSYFISSIVSTDSSKIQGGQSLSQRVIQFTKKLGGNVLSIHDGDYSKALQPVADFVLREVALKYEVEPSTLSILKGVRVIRAGQEIQLKIDTDYKIEESALVFNKGSVLAGDKVLLDLVGAK